jgi:hypothetical protein
MDTKLTVLTGAGKRHNQIFVQQTKAESFYYVNYGSSIITSKNISNENLKTGVSRAMILQK